MIGSILSEDAGQTCKFSLIEDTIVAASFRTFKATLSGDYLLLNFQNTESSIQFSWVITPFEYQRNIFHFNI